MKFQKKIIVVYMAFSVLISSLLGSICYFLNVRQYEEREYGNITTISNVKLQQMEDVIGGMESVILYFLSDEDILEDLETLAELKPASYDELYFNKAVRNIHSKITNYYLIQEFYQVVVFNKRGIVISNRNYKNMLPPAFHTSFHNYPWLCKVQGKGGEDVILGVHKDDWSNVNAKQVLSVVKEIQGMDMGYVEVQKDKEALDSFFKNGEKSLGYLFFTKKGDLIYSTESASDTQYYKKIVGKVSSGISEIKTEKGNQEICYKQKSKSKDFILLTIEKKNIKEEATLAALPVSLLLLVGLLLLSFGYIYLTSRQLTRPIHQLKNFMETTHIENMMEAKIPEKISNDEIEVLYVSYKNVLERLNISMIREKRMSLLQLQAQFDLLQAQVNPHFIYNVLNVISARGVLSGDEAICDICARLAGMLRYSTNTRDKYASVKAETGYLEMYLGLLKYRYDYKLCYHININDNIKEKILPKIALQQIVENCVNHGWSRGVDVMEVVVEGGEDSTGWYIRIHDNGAGITPQKQKGIMEAMEMIKNKLTSDRENVELEIGGMGLVNVYARLYLLYNESLKFAIEPDEEGGTKVTIQVFES